MALEATPAGGDTAARGERPATGDRRPGDRRPGELVLALTTLALGVFVLVQAGGITVPGSTNTLGPRAFPYLVGAMAAVVGAVLVVAVLRGRYGREEGGEDVDPDAKTDWTTVALLAAVLVVHVFTINILGWPFAAAILFGGAAVVLGARPWWRAVLAGLTLGLVIQVVFGGLLGLSLPPGPLLEGMAIFRG
jgi:putative tricarboxylic transport membrane protein